MPPRFFFPSSLSSSRFAAVLCPLCESNYIEQQNTKNTLGPEMLDDLAQVTMFLHQFVGCFRANTLYWLEIIAAEQ